MDRVELRGRVFVPIIRPQNAYSAAGSITKPICPLFAIVQHPKRGRVASTIPNRKTFDYHIKNGSQIYIEEKDVLNYCQAVDDLLVTAKNLLEYNGIAITRVWQIADVDAALSDGDYSLDALSEDEKWKILESTLGNEYLCGEINSALKSAVSDRVEYLTKNPN